MNVKNELAVVTLGKRNSRNMRSAGDLFVYFGQISSLCLCEILMCGGPNIKCSRGPVYVHGSSTLVWDGSSPYGVLGISP